jgi:hypothetical protein
MKLYVYEHRRPDRDECFYVGKGRGRRANKLSDKRNAHHKAVQAKLAKLGLAVEVRLVKGGLAEAVAFALEVERIAFWRAAGVSLANKTCGGEGSAGAIRESGWKHTEEAKAKVSAAMEGKNRAGNRRGVPCSEETKAKISAANKGKRSLLGRKLSEETRAKISKSVSERQRGAANPFFGKTHSAETRAKISATKKAARGTCES